MHSFALVALVVGIVGVVAVVAVVAVAYNPQISLALNHQLTALSRLI